MSTGCERTYREFQQLLGSEYDHPYSAPLIRKWFGYEVIRDENGFIIRDQDGREVDPLRVYEATQSNPEWRYTLYQLSQNLWR